MKKLLTLTLICLGSCTAPDWTTETLEKAGFTNIQTHGYAWFACSDDDHFNTKFTATNVNGQTVNGAVCCGWFKGCTVRF